MTWTFHVRGRTCFSLSTVVRPAFTRPSPRSVPLRFRLIPRDEVYFELLAGAADCLVDSAEKLARMLGSDRANRARLAGEIHELERTADEATRDLLRRLDRTFVTPFDRNDLHTLATGLDDCVDAIDEAADFLVVHKIGELPAAVGQIVGAISRSADLTRDAVAGLRRLDGMHGYREEVVQHADRARRTYRHLLGDLLDGDPDVVAVLKITHVLDALDAATSAMRRLADVVEALALQES